MFEKGTFDLGYEIDKKLTFKLRFNERTPIGIFYCTFDIVSYYACRASSYCTGYSISKRQWMDCLNFANKTISVQLKLRIIREYIKK